VLQHGYKAAASMSPELCRALLAFDVRGGRRGERMALRQVGTSPPMTMGVRFA
jgi:hypothetical protein